VVARIDKQVPMGVFLGVVGDAANDSAAPTRFRFNQHRDMLNAKLAVVVGVIAHRQELRIRHECDDRQVCGRGFTN